MARLALSLFGSFTATLDGALITTFESNKVRALLAYLAAEADRPHRREALAALLWPDWPQQSAMSNLRYALADLRKNIGDREAQLPFLLITRESIQLNRKADVWVDVGEFESAIRDLQSAEASGFLARNLQSAISLYRGEFLEGFSLTDSPTFEQWVLARREGFHRQALQALFSLVEAHEQQGELEAALPYARRQVELEPWHEPGQQQLMRLLALSGQRSAALAQYDACRKALADELQVEPSAETKRLYEAIRDENMEGIRERGTGVSPIPFPLSLVPLPPAPGEAPFKGLQYFDVGDANLFFGREALTARLVGHIREMAAASVGASRSDKQGSLDDREGSPLQEGCCFLAVVGASGSGKSSVVRAGVVPALLSGKPLADGTLPPEGSPGWHIHVFTPTAHPLESLAVSLMRETRSVSDTAKLMDDLAQEPRSLHLFAQHLLAPLSPGLAGKCRLLLVVDQFEELFTLCRSETERTAFLDNLLTAVQGGGPTQVVVVLRADFYGHCAQYPKLRQALCARQEYIGPMEAAELRRAIEEPARRNGWEFEPGLVELILRDIGVSEDHPPEPGALPLLEHALLETWQRRNGRTLTHQGYVEAGGVHGAIAKTAEGVFTRLTPEQQALARRIFLRLTELGEGTQDTRRRAPLSELAPTGEDASQVLELLKELADARLITLSEDTAEVAHEALIREWPALRQWLSEDRDGLRLHRHLTDSAEAWAELECDPGELYRGARLAQATEWAASHPEDLNALERQFLQASQAQAEHEAAEREAQRQRELETARKLAETERQRAEQQAQAAAEQAANARRLRQRAWALAGVLGLALLLVVATIWLAQEANRSAAQARANAQQANAEANTRATAEAQAVAQQGTAEAERGRADEQKDAALAAQTTAEAERGRADAQKNVAIAARSTAEAERLRAEDNAAAAVAAQTEADVQRLNAEQQAALTFARELASNASLNLEQDSQLSLLLALQAVSVTQQAGFDPIPWDVQQALHDIMIKSRLVYAIPEPSGAPLYNLFYSPDGKWLAVTVDMPGGGTRIYKASTGQELVSYDGFLSAISPDGKWIAVDEIEKGYVKDFFTGERLITITVSVPPPWVSGFSFSPDGNWLAWSGDGQGEPPRLWDLTAWRQEGAQPGLTLTLTDAARTLAGCSGIYAPVAFSPDGQRLATNCDSLSTLKVWDFSTGQGLWESPAQMGMVGSFEFSPDGSRIASCDYSGNVLVWDAATGKQLLTLKGFVGYGQTVTYSPDGSMIAAAGQEGAMVWNAEWGYRLMSVSTAALGADFSLDGKRLAVARVGRLEMWDITALAGGEMAMKPLPAQWGDDEVSDDLTQWIVSRPDGVVEFIRSGTLETFSEWQVYTPTAEEPEIYFVPILNRDNTLLATAHTQVISDTKVGTISIWDVATRRKMMDLQAPGEVRFPAFNPDSTLLVSGGEWGVTIWDLTTGKELRTLSIPLNYVFWPRFSPDGTRLAVNGSVDLSSRYDSRILIWDMTPGVAQLEDPLEIKAFDQDPGYFYFSPDGNSLVASAKDGVKVFDTNTGELRINIPGHGVPSYMSMYSPDGKYIVAGWINGMTRVYEAQTGIELLSYPSPGDFDDIMVAFTPDGQRIISIGGDNAFQQFAFLDFADLVSVARSRLTRTWTQEECRKYLHTEACPSDPRPQP
jgi:WD40 repeat protein/DNA-binding SARP family transcriptional activator